MRVKLFIALGMLGMSLFTYAGSRHAARLLIRVIKIGNGGISRLVSWTAGWYKSRLWPLWNRKAI